MDGPSSGSKGQVRSAHWLARVVPGTTIVVLSLATPALGLSRQDAAGRLLAFGPNEIQREHPAPVWRLLLGQFNSPVIWLLVGACAVSVALGEAADAVGHRGDRRS